MLHLTNGDSAGNSLRQAGLAGDVVEQGDVLYEGPVPADLPVEAHAAACRVLMEWRNLAAYIPAIGQRVARKQAERQRRIEALLQAGVAASEWPSTTNVPLRATLVRATLHGLMATWHVAPGSFDWRAVASTLADWERVP